MKGIATQNSFDGKIKAFPGTMFFDGLQGILGTSRSIPAGPWKKRRDANLIKAYQKTEEFRNEIPQSLNKPAFWHNVLNCAHREWNESFPG
jgi:hypothetical protein